MANLYRVYPSPRQLVKIWKFKIIRETKTKYYVGECAVPGGYIKKGLKSDFTSLKDAKRAIQSILKNKIETLTDQLLAAKTAHDVYVDGIEGKETLVDTCLVGSGLMREAWWGYW